MKPDFHIMIIESDPVAREALNAWLAGEGYHVIALESGESAIKLVHERLWDLLIFSLSPSGISGTELLKDIFDKQPNIPVIVLTGQSQLKEASEAVKMGATRYIAKPLDHSEVLSSVKKIAEYRVCAKENELLRQRLDVVFALQPMIGKSKAILEIKERVKTVGPGDTPVMIYGEPGVGKEYLAKTLHANSDRKYMPFETSSLGSMPEALMESEIFGHEKAAFTGASFVKKGRMELANFGTIYLDEIGELSPDLQMKIDQVIERKEFRRVDGTQIIRGDVRIICSTRFDLKTMVKEGKFNESLYRKFDASSFSIPPLYERPEDIPLLADHFLQIFSARINKRIKRISRRALEFLTDYSWPGNVHELQNAIERAVILARNDRVNPDDLPFSIRGYLAAPRTKSIKEWEKSHIRRVLGENTWNISKSAKDLDIDRVTLYNKIKKYGLKKPGTETEFEDNSKKKK